MKIDVEQFLTELEILVNMDSGQENPDEEIGSIYSKDLIDEYAKNVTMLLYLKLHQQMAPVQYKEMVCSEAVCNFTEKQGTQAISTTAIQFRQ